MWKCLKTLAEIIFLIDETSLTYQPRYSACLHPLRNCAVIRRVGDRAILDGEVSSASIRPWLAPPARTASLHTALYVGMPVM